MATHVPSRQNWFCGQVTAAQGSASQRPETQRWPLAHGKYSQVSGTHTRREGSQRWPVAQVTAAQGATTVELVHEKRVAAFHEKPAVANAQPPDFSDPVVVEELLRKVSRETAALEAKSRIVTDSPKKEDFQKELDKLAKKRAALETRLAKLQKGK
ncbi:MAG: hypothetical protein HY900_06300 [Deltaproteobacteria bacterium]|nr:hypothetical protein [Deltaproteobacteria bacterium]